LFTRKLKRSGVSGQLFTLLLIVVAFTVGTRGKFLEWKNIQVMLSIAGIPAILAIGLHQVILLGSIDLSLEGVMGFTIVFVGILGRSRLNNIDVGLWILPISIAIGACSGMGSGFVVSRARIPSFISTLGMSWILYGIAVYINKAAGIPLLDDRIQLALTGYILGIPTIFLIALALMVFMQLIQDRTRFGKFMYAIGGDEQLAKQAGINVNRTKVIIFTIAGAVYGLAALFLASKLGRAHPRTGLANLFPTITAVTVGGVALTGGIGGAKNALLGALILTALNDGLILMMVDPYIKEAINGVVLITAIALTIDRKKLGFIK
jgi:ribose/xylose/arabinose/galactoside ABC-type transport system permease subunit